MKKYTKHLLNKNNGDIVFSKKVISNKASLANSDEELEILAESFQELEVLEYKLKK